MRCAVGPRTRRALTLVWLRCASASAREKRRSSTGSAEAPDPLPTLLPPLPLPLPPQQGERMTDHYLLGEGMGFSKGRGALLPFPSRFLPVSARSTPRGGAPAAAGGKGGEGGDPSR